MCGPSEGSTRLGGSSTRVLGRTIIYWWGVWKKLHGEEVKMMWE